MKPITHLMDKRLGFRVRSIEHLASIAELGRAVVAFPKFNGLAEPRPAAFVLQWPGSILLNLLSHGLFLYHKEGNCLATD